MSAKKTKASNGSGLFPLLKFAATQGRWFVVGALALVALAVAWKLAWNRVRGHVLASPDYIVEAKDIVMTQLPPWIDTDIKKEALEIASLEDSLSILEPDLTKRIANAFSLHPWVAKVHRVSKKHPARIEVELSYRQPVAMVEVSDGLLAVDAEATVLPSKDFSPAETKNYARISGIESHPIGPEGKSWGDAQVFGAARIAAAIGNRWQSLKLRRIVAPPRRPTATLDPYTYELITHGGTRLIWGRPPGEEPQGELPALAKIELMETLAAQFGSLDAPDAPRQIDLRRADAPMPRTVTRPKPPTR